MTTPKWAQNLIIEGCLFLEIEDAPQITWRHGGKYYKLSSGCTYTEERRIVITAGQDRTDAKLVLLHELSHIANPNTHHSSEFWDTAWKLYRHFKLPIRYCLNREKTYRKGAVIAYRRNKGEANKS